MHFVLQPSTDQAYTPQLREPKVTCYYRPGQELPMDNITISVDQMEQAICRYTRAQAAEGNISVSVNGANTFGYSVSLQEFSSDGRQIH